MSNVCYPADTGRKLKVHKTSKTSSERFMYVQFTSCVYRVLGRSFDFLRSNLVVTARYLMVTTGYCSLLVVTARYRSLLLVPNFSMNAFTTQCVICNTSIARYMYSLSECSRSESNSEHLRWNMRCTFFQKLLTSTARQLFS